MNFPHDPSPLDSNQTPRSEDAQALPGERDVAVCWLSAAVLMGFLCLTQAGMMLSLLADRMAMAWVAPAALLLALIGADQMGRRMSLGWGGRLMAATLALSAIGFALAMSAYCFDLSFDGQWYHQRAILQMAEGWNPLKQPFDKNLIMWTAYFAKGPWYVAAAIYKLTGLIELGKSTMWITWAAMVFASYAAVRDWKMRRGRAVAIAMAMAMLPVVWSEISSYLLDGVMTATLMVLVAAVFGGLRRPTPIVVCVGMMAAIFCASTKLNGLIYQCIVFAAGWLCCVLRRREWLVRYTGLAALALVLGVGVFGYNPYVTNTIKMQNPLYPAVGTNKLEKANDCEIPKNLLDQNRFVRLGYAIFGRPGNAPYAGQKNAKLMWPFTARVSDFSIYRFQEGRIAFFGPYFSGVLLLAMGLLAWVMFQSKMDRLVLAIVSLTIIGSLLMSPLLWWPRLGPQLWLLPMIPVIAIFVGECSRRAVAAAWVIVLLLTVNGAIVATVGMAWETNASQTLRGQLSELRDSGKMIEVKTGFFGMATERRLKDWGVIFRMKDPKEKLSDGTELVTVPQGYPGNIRYRYMPAPEENPQNIEDKPRPPQR